jgi:hypothetical protein
MAEEVFQKLDAELTQGGSEHLLTLLADQFRAEQKYHELFDILLMRERLRLQLPPTTTSIDELPEPARSQLENAYLNICREVGDLLLSQQNVREAWPYLRPLGDRTFVAARLAAIEPNEDNLQALVEILLHEGVDVSRGYQLVLDHYGTCNAISAFEGLIMTKSKADRQDAAEKLIRQIHEELSVNLRADFEQREGTPPQESTLRELLAKRPGQVGDSYHIDTSHLASAVRYARMLERPECIRFALDLAEYGKALSPQFQFADQEPFVDAYAMHARFFAAQLGESVDDALETFRQRAEQVDAYREGTLAAEVYVVLLTRLGRHAEAIAAAAKMLPPGTHTTGFAPTLMELCQQSGDYTQLLQVCRDRDDQVGYAAALLAQNYRVTA